MDEATLREDVAQIAMTVARLERRCGTGRSRPQPRAALAAVKRTRVC